MPHPDAPPPRPCPAPPERGEHETGPRRERPPAVDLGYLPASAHGFEHLTLEQWLDLCA